MTTPGASLPPDEDLAWISWLGTTVSVVLGTVAVLLRVIARRKSAAGFWWDDYTIMLAMVFLWGMGITRWISLAEFSYGRHAVYAGKENVVNYLKTSIGAQALYFTTTITTKASFLLLYHRIFAVVKRFRYALWISGFLVGGYFIATIILTFVGCLPFEKHWRKEVPGNCINLVLFFRVSGICDMILDFLIFCLPLPMVWQLKLPLRQRFMLTGIFALGLFTCITSILRVLTFYPDQINDSTYSTIPTTTWSIIEQGMGILCACLPTLRPLFFSIRSSPATNIQTTTSLSKSNELAYPPSIYGKRPRSTTLVGTGDPTSMWKQHVYDHENDSTVGFARMSDEEHAMSSVEVRQSLYYGLPTDEAAAYTSQVGTAVTAGEEVSIETEDSGANDEEEPEERQGGGRRGVTPTGLPVSLLGGIVKESRIEITEGPRGEHDLEEDLWKGGEI